MHKITVLGAALTEAIKETPSLWPTHNKPKSRRNEQALRELQTYVALKADKRASPRTR